RRKRTRQGACGYLRTFHRGTPGSKIRRRALSGRRSIGDLYRPAERPRTPFKWGSNPEIRVIIKLLRPERGKSFSPQGRSLPKTPVALIFTSPLCARRRMPLEFLCADGHLPPRDAALH